MHLTTAKLMMPPQALLSNLRCNCQAGSLYDCEQHLYSKVVIVVVYTQISSKKTDVPQLQKAGECR